MLKRVFKTVSYIPAFYIRGAQIFLDYFWFIRFSLLKPFQDRISASIKIHIPGNRHSDTDTYPAVQTNTNNSRAVSNSQSIHQVFTQNTYDVNSQNPPLLVFLPGIYEGKLYFHCLTEILREYDILQLDHLGKMELPTAVIAKNVIQDLRRIHRPIILIAHSKGGLVGRAVLAAQLPHIHGLIAFATPWNGSSCAKLFPLRHPLRMLEPGGSDIVIPWSESLEREVTAKIISLSPHWDLHVPEGSFLCGAKNIELHSCGHFRPLYLSDGIRALRKAIIDFSEQIRIA